MKDKNRLRTPHFWSRGATAFLHPWTRRFLLVTKTCCMDLMGTSLREHTNVC